MENKEVGEKLIESVGSKPNGGVYGDDSFWEAYIDLVRSVGRLIPKDSSHGALQNKGVGSIAVARCKAVALKAQATTEIMNAITTGRK